MQTKTAPMTRPAAQAASPTVCRTVPLRKLPGIPRGEIACCELPKDTPAQLLHVFQSAPQFSKIPPGKMLPHALGRHRMILLGPNSYYLRQAAAYLSAISSHREEDSKPSPSGSSDYWRDLELSLDDFELEDEPDCAAALKDSMAVVNPATLDPDIGMGGEEDGAVSMAKAGQPQKVLQLDKLDAAAILIAADSGAVLSEGVLDQIEALLQKENAPDLFIALKPGQEELDLLEELRFTHGFQFCDVGQADQTYLRSLLTQAAQKQLVSLAPTVDLDKVINHLRRYRGNRFEESDLEQLLTRAVECTSKTTLDTADLLFRPRKAASQGRKKLDEMVGLAPVKDAMRRLLATAILEDRRRMSGVELVPGCRNMAFSGPPGTGKSVTARLCAQILREEGCGTGRFVEAGREQLIAPYLGQTSPMIAKLFQKARGGVLFIDEAGALLTTDGRDSYATEAVNALVRHMELEPETMVIFATYPQEMQKLLSSNPGLSSRVAQVLDFGGYDDEQLFEIFCSFAQQEQMAVAEDTKAACVDFFRRLRDRKGPDFGNGREARRLFQAAKEEMALRTLQAPEQAVTLTEEDVLAAARRLLAQEQQENKRVIGF